MESEKNYKKSVKRNSFQKILVKEISQIQSIRNFPKEINNKKTINHSIEKCIFKNHKKYLSHQKFT